MKKQLIFVCVGFTILVVVLVFALSAYYTAFAEGNEYFVLCKPEMRVNVRVSPKKRAEVIGWLECGDKVTTDGKEQNGFVHVVGLEFEFTDGWIYKGLLISERPCMSGGQCGIVSDGRVAARVYINGKRKSWIQPGQGVIVYAIGRTWSITDKGYVKTEFLSLNYPEISQQGDGG